MFWLIEVNFSFVPAHTFRYAVDRGGGAIGRNTSPQVARYRILHVDTRYPANIHTHHAGLPWTLACKLSCSQFTARHLEIVLWLGYQELSLCGPGPGSSSHWSNLMQTRGSDYLFPIQTKLQMVGSVSPCQVCVVSRDGGRVSTYLHISIHIYTYLHISAAIRLYLAIYTGQHPGFPHCSSSQIDWRSVSSSTFPASSQCGLTWDRLISFNSSSLQIPTYIGIRKSRIPIKKIS